MDKESAPALRVIIYIGKKMNRNKIFLHVNFKNFVL